MRYEQAKAIAEKWTVLLAPFCERIEIAGSIRRGKKEVTDIDLVAIPKIKTESDLFGGQGTQINLLEQALQKLFWDCAYLAVPKNGPRYKQLVLPEGIHLELWIVLPPAEWGVQFLIRTGPAEFGHWCVTTKREGGALPSYLRVQDGAIWSHGNKLVTPEESDFFEVLGLKFIEPARRTAQWTGATER